MEEESTVTRNGPKTFTHGRAERASGRIQKEIENLRDQNAPDSFLVGLEAIVIGLLEYEQRNRPIDHEKLAADVLAQIRANR
jgi:hypothetical protein